MKCGSLVLNYSRFLYNYKSEGGSSATIKYNDLQIINFMIYSGCFVVAVLIQTYSELKLSL